MAVRYQYSIRIWESGEWQTRTAECRQKSANPLLRNQMVVDLKRKRLGEMRRPSLMYMCSGAGNGTRTRDPLLGKQGLQPWPLQDSRGNQKALTDDSRHATIALLDAAPMSIDSGSDDSGEVLATGSFCA